jgi:hypothetical protein
MFSQTRFNSWTNNLLSKYMGLKNYYLPVSTQPNSLWILPANFFVKSQEWFVSFELGKVTIFLTTVTGQNICLKKKMSVAEKKQFEIDWLAFQSSTTLAFDLRSFDL